MKALEKPSILPTPSTSRKPPKVRVYQKDQKKSFVSKDTISCFDQLNMSHCPPGYQYHSTTHHVIFYCVVFDEETSFPTIEEAITIDKKLHVQLQYCGCPVPFLQDLSLVGVRS